VLVTLVLVEFYAKEEQILDQEFVLQNLLPGFRVVYHQVLIWVDFSLNFEVAHVIIVRCARIEEFEYMF